MDTLGEVSSKVEIIFMLHASKLSLSSSGDIHALYNVCSLSVLSAVVER